MLLSQSVNSFSLYFACPSEQWSSSLGAEPCDNLAPDQMLKLSNTCTKMLDPRQFVETIRNISIVVTAKQVLSKWRNCIWENSSPIAFHCLCDEWKMARKYNSLWRWSVLCHDGTCRAWRSNYRRDCRKGQVRGSIVMRLATPEKVKIQNSNFRNQQNIILVAMSFMDRIMVLDHLAKQRGRMHKHALCFQILIHNGTASSLGLLLIT